MTETAEVAGRPIGRERAVGAAAAAADAVRVLVVGEDAALGQSVEAALAEAGVHAAVSRADGYLHALASLAGGQCSPRPQMVLGRMDSLGSEAAWTLEGLRGLLPGVRLVAVCAGRCEQAAASALAAGFDACAFEPLAGRQLAEAMAMSHSPAESRDADPGVRRRVQALHREVRRRLVGDGLCEEAARPAGAAGPLGDADLIDHLLGGHDGLRAMAVQVLRAHAGIGGLSWVDSVAAVPAGDASWPVVVGGLTCGCLCAAAPAQAATLAPWAGWLGRWLTLERRLDQLWALALRDPLTGVWNRRYLDRFLEALLAQATQERFRVTVLVFDIDDFKLYNDRWGHAAGDEILREAARLMQSVVREHDVVARVGGDEFAVVFWDAEAPRQPHSEHPVTIRTAARRFQQAICQHRFPKLAEEAPGTLAISGGLAGYPWDGRTPQELLDRADQMALKSKRAGKNVITCGPGALGACEQPAHEFR